MQWASYLYALAVLLGAGVVTWLVSIRLHDASIVDSLWSLFFLVAVVVFALSPEALGTRGIVVLVLVTIWSLRLSIHITVRNWGGPEDARYQEIRENNEPGFWWKSAFIVFGLQATLAWLISSSLFAATTSATQLGALDYLAIALWIFGFAFEAVGDLQLSRFKADPDNEGEVLDAGLWRYTRHPNYFGEFCIWWAFYLFAVAAGGWWAIVSPLLMSYLLLKVSGVALLEKSISERRPKYAEYVERTNAFFPGPRKGPGSGNAATS